MPYTREKTDTLWLAALLLEWIYESELLDITIYCNFQYYANSNLVPRAFSRQGREDPGIGRSRDTQKFGRFEVDR
jgi:hypothetical protein